jgi:hypothetical protein
MELNISTFLDITKCCRKPSEISTRTSVVAFLQDVISQKKELFPIADRITSVPAWVELLRSTKK